MAGPGVIARYGSGIVGTEWNAILVNRQYQRDATKVGFIYCPPYGTGAWAIGGMGPVWELARRGYPIICGDLVCTPTVWGGSDGAHKWGADAALTAMSTYKTYLQSTLGAKAGKIGLLYGSGGCPAAYAFAAAHPADICCIAGAIGAADVEDVRANNRNGYQASVETAYTNNAGWQTARLTHNPVQVADFAIPQLDYYSTDDPICVATTHTELAAKAGVQMTQVSLGAIGHSIGVLLDARDPASVAFADWVEAHLT